MRNGVIQVLILLCYSWCQYAIAQQFPMSVVADESKVLQYLHQGKATGPSVDILNMLLKEAELSAEISFMPWMRAFNIASTQPNTLIMTIVRTPEREESFYWISKVSTTVKAFISLKKNFNQENLTIEDAKKKLVSAIRGSVSANFLLENGFSQNKNLYLVADVEQIIQLLLKNKVDFAFCDPSLLYHYFAEKKQHNEQYINVFPVESTRRSGYIALSKTSDKGLLERLTAAQLIIEKDPKYHQLVKFRPLLAPSLN